jgi:hypothetical protein
MDNRWCTHSVHLYITLEGDLHHIPETGSGAGGKVKVLCRACRRPTCVLADLDCVCMVESETFVFVVVIVGAT